MRPLRVHIPDFALLDHGQIIESEDKYTLIPPATPVIDQLIPRIDALPNEYPSFQTAVLGIGFCALAVRWGSYFATLVDEAATLHPDLPGSYHPQPEDFSWISDSEMKRLNIEISYNIYRLVQLFRERGTTEFFHFLTKAYSHLPMPHKQIKMSRETLRLFFGCLHQGSETVQGYEKGDTPGVFATTKDGVTEYSIRRIQEGEADRFLANILTVHGWRNTVIESIHGGDITPSLLLPHQRRFTHRGYLKVMREITANFGATLVMMDTLFDPDYRYQNLLQWPQTATAMANTYCGMFTHDWSLTESSSDVRLYK